MSRKYTKVKERYYNADTKTEAANVIHDIRVVEAVLRHNALRRKVVRFEDLVELNRKVTELAQMREDCITYITGGYSGYGGPN